MDTSKENIKMLEKAKEIQKLRRLGNRQWGDFYCFKLSQKSKREWYANGKHLPEDTIIIMANEWHSADIGMKQEPTLSFPDRDYIWLPRQDQLQEMVREEEWGCDWTDHLLDDFENWRREYGIQNWTMEQLWLAFVMKKKYNKTWSESDWVTEREK